MGLSDLSSKKYESSGDPGAYGGGASYGAYQFATQLGISQASVRWL